MEEELVGRLLNGLSSWSSPVGELLPHPDLRGPSCWVTGAGVNFSLAMEFGS